MCNKLRFIAALAVSTAIGTSAASAHHPGVGAIGGAGGIFTIGAETELKATMRKLFLGVVLSSHPRWGRATSTHRLQCGFALLRARVPNQRRMSAAPPLVLDARR